MTKELTLHKLNTPLKMKVLAMIARGEKYGTIVRILKDEHNVEYSQSALSDMRKRHADVIKEMELNILEAQTSDSAAAATKSTRLLNRMLDRATGDEQEMLRIDEDYREGRIKTLAEYRRKKAGLLKMSITELVMISKEMNQQAKAGKPLGFGTSKKSVASGETGDSLPENVDPSMAEALLMAIERGDTVGIREMIVNPAG